MRHRKARGLAKNIREAKAARRREREHREFRSQPKESCVGSYPRVVVGRKLEPEEITGEEGKHGE